MWWGCWVGSRGLGHLRKGWSRGAAMAEAFYGGAEAEAEERGATAM
jgi:hypothetical protein